MATIHEFDESYLFKLIDEKLANNDLKNLMETRAQKKKKISSFLHFSEQSHFFTNKSIYVIICNIKRE